MSQLYQWRWSTFFPPPAYDSAAHEVAGVTKGSSQRQCCVKSTVSSTFFLHPGRRITEEADLHLFRTIVCNQHWCVKFSGWDDNRATQSLISSLTWDKEASYSVRNGIFNLKCDYVSVGSLSKGIEWYLFSFNNNHHHQTPPSFSFTQWLTSGKLPVVILTLIAAGWRERERGKERSGSDLMSFDSLVFGIESMEVLLH